MSHKKSLATVEKNKSVWAKNLVPFQKSRNIRRSVPMEDLPLSNKSRMPLKKVIVGRYLYLGQSIKGRKERVAEIAKELILLWTEKLNFPMLSEQAIRAKLDKLLKTYDECSRRVCYEPLEDIFDITKANGVWLNSQDKELHQKQLASKGQVGYSTGKPASITTIHPSKRRKVVSTTQKDVQDVDNLDIFSSSESSADISEVEELYEPDDSDDAPSQSRKRHTTSVATNLITSTSVSTSKAAKICQNLSQDGIAIPTPSQSGVYRALFKKAAEIKEELKQSLHKEEWSLHFDGKKIEGKEYQAVVLKNERREIKLTALELEDGKAATIANGLSEVIDEYELWGAIKMIVADTTSVNTGRKSGVVVRVQEMIRNKGYEAPQFISCQHHVLDRVLRWVMDRELTSQTTSPNIEYFFVSDLMTNYNDLKADFLNGTVRITDKSGWRDDMKFLYHLTRVFRFFRDKGQFPLVEFKKIPNISNARWNSRAILAILAFILMPSARRKLEKVCCFISYAWADHWFADHMFRAADYDELAEALLEHKSARDCLQKHWKREPSRIAIPRSNQCCERAIKVLQDVHAACKDKQNLPLRFVLTNAH